MCLTCNNSWCHNTDSTLQNERSQACPGSDNAAYILVLLGSLVVLGIVGQPTSSSGKGLLEHLEADGVFVCKGCLIALHLVVCLGAAKQIFILSLVC